MGIAALTIERGGRTVATELSRLIQQVMDDTGDSQSDIARRAGMSPQAISAYLRGVPLSRLEKDTVLKLVKGLRVDAWTIIRAVAADMTVSDTIAVDPDDLTIEQIEVLARSLPPAERRRMLRILHIALNADDDTPEEG